MDSNQSKEQAILLIAANLHSTLSTKTFSILLSTALYNVLLNSVNQTSILQCSTASYLTPISYTSIRALLPCDVTIVRTTNPFLLHHAALSELLFQSECST